MKRHSWIFLLLVFLMRVSKCLGSHFDVTTQSPSMKEGSCIELTLTFKQELYGLPSNWFWAKDAYWSTSQNNFIGKVILSSNTNRWPVHPAFVGRTKSQSFTTPSQRYAGTSLIVLLCNITKSDSGKYSFIYQFTVGEHSPWAEEGSARVNVEENPCPIHLNELPTLEEDAEQLVMCITDDKCPVAPQLLDHNLTTKLIERKHINTMAFGSFKASWQNDGKEIGCEVKGNTDKYLRKYITLNIRYSPKRVFIKFIEGITYFQEGDDMTLVCTAIGNPIPTFEWFKNDDSKPLVNGARFRSVGIQHNGKYKCVATNDLGVKSAILDVDIKYPPIVEVQSPQTKFKQGQAMTLSCQVKRGNPWPDSFMWHKDNKLVASQKEYTVPSMQPEHAGRYTCAAFNVAFKDMTAMSAERLIDVEYRPRETSLSFVGSTSSGVKAGASILLKCTTDGNPAPNEYAWSLLNIDGRSWEKLPGRSEDQLLLSAVRQRNGACYRCRGVNKEGPGEDSEPLCIKVLYRPTNLQLSMPDKVTEGKLVSVRCSANSVPLSDLTLTRRPSDRSSVWSGATELGKTAQNNVLSYNFTATSADKGVYTCEATNSEGRGITQKTLQIAYAPRNVMVKASPSLVVAKTMALTLQCVADSNVPIESVIWWKADQNVTEGHSLTIGYITLADAGIYACTAINEMGSARSPPVKVEVHNRPSDPVLSMATNVTEGELVSMLCSVKSDPLSILTLTRVSDDRSSVWPGASSRGNAVQNNTLSHTFNAAWADSGVYTCEAENGFGRRSTQKTLKVSYAPKNVEVSAHPSLAVAENATLTLQCNADSYPPVESVMWWMVNSTRSQNLPSGQTLTIMSFTPADAGFYGCTATNALGSLSSSPAEVKVMNLLTEKRTSNTDVFLKFIIPPVGVLFIVILISICWLRIKRNGSRVSRRDTQVSGKPLAEIQTSKFSSDNISNEFSYSMCDIVSAGKDPSVAGMAQEEPHKDDVLQDTSREAERRQRNFARYDVYKEKQSKETRSKSVSNDGEVYLSLAQVHFRPKRPSGEGAEDEDNNHFEFTV